MSAPKDKYHEKEEPTLIYPCKNVPETGTVYAVAPGILWIRMPMPFAPMHINLWAIEENDGWAIIDTGLYSKEITAAWQQLLAGPLASKAITRVLITHMHPDHVGMAGWLTRKFNCRLWMTALEYFTCRRLIADAERTAPEESIHFYRKAGWNEDILEYYRTRFGLFGKLIQSLPDSYRRLQDQELITIGNHQWTVVVGNGHSPEHACLYCPNLKILISGDQVLPKISSNVSVYPIEPDADPLKDWLSSLEKIKREVPDDVLVLPSHNEPFHGLHERIDTLASSVAKALAQLRETLQEPKRVIDVFTALFSRKITSDDYFQFSLATGESIAYLNYLIGQGEVTMQFDHEGIAWYRMS